MPIAPDLSTDGTAEVRLLCSSGHGALVHARVQRGCATRATRDAGFGQLAWVESGEGALWRAGEGFGDVTVLRRGTCVSIPAGVAYQYRTGAQPLELVIATAAPRAARDALAVTGYWDERGHVLSAAGLEGHPGPWTTADLAAASPELAPDGSEIRPLAEVDTVGVAHCRLGAGRVTRAVRHRTVDEGWFVLSGRGALWRSEASGEEIVPLEPGCAVSIPVATSFQFRSSAAADLEILIATFPPWPGAAEAEPVEGRWALD